DDSVEPGPTRSGGRIKADNIARTTARLKADTLSTKVASSSCLNEKRILFAVMQSESSRAQLEGEMTIFPILPRQTHQVEYIWSTKRLHQNIVSAQTDHFRPKTTARRLITHSQQWRFSQERKLTSQILPVAVRHVGPGDDQR